MKTVIALTCDVRLVHPVEKRSVWTNARGKLAGLAGLILLVSLLMPGGWSSPLSCSADLTQTITFGTLADRTYGDPDFAPGATASSGLPVSYASSNPAVATISGDTVHIVGAGTTNITASQAGDATYYPATDVVQPLIVNKADPTVTAWPTASSITYGQTLASSTLTGGSASTAGTFVFTNPATAPDAGTAAQSVTFTPTDTTNYNTVTGSVDVTVAKADPTVTAWPTASTIIYGQTLASSTLTGGTVSVAGTFAFTTSTIAPNAGTAGQSVTFTPSDTANYNTVTGSNDVTVNPAQLTVTADDLTKTYGAANPSLSISYSGFVNGDTSTSLTVQPTATTTATTDSPVGTYPITVSGGVGDNYSFTYVAGTLTINKAMPTVTLWPTADAITYGQTLASSTLTGGNASVSGSFAFTTPTTAPDAGTAAQSVTFTPADTANYNAVTGSVDVTVAKADPTVTAWPTATAITYGQTLTSSSITGGSASTPGTFEFTNPANAPDAGTAAQSVTFTPVDTTNYNAVAGSVDVTVTKADPTVTAWPTATAIIYGQTLASSSLAGGTSSTAGTFAFTNPATAPDAGTAAQSVTFTPADTANYTTLTGSVDVTVTKADPTVITWPTAGTITYGDTLASSTLTGGTASVAGTFAFTVPATAPGAGMAAQSVTFTPADLTNYNTQTGSVVVTVNPAVLTVTADDQTKTYGAANPTLTVSYSGFVNGETAVNLTIQPTAGTTATTNSSVGTYPITVSGGVGDNYSFTYVAGTLTINKAMPTVTMWPTADAITYGQTLASSALTGGSASASGTFAFTNPATAPDAGTAAQSVTFTPSDTTNYNTVTGSVDVAVGKADPTVTTWPTASAITYGQTLASSTLTGGTASVAGIFAFTTPITAPNAGSAAQSVTFTPTDTTNYNAVTGSVDVTVNKADPTVTAWPTASAISYGQTLASSSLAGGTASTAGTFAFTNPVTAPDAGTAAQSVTFTPSDATNYNTVIGSVDVTVNKVDPTVTTWPTASAITYGQTLTSSTLTGGAASVAGNFTFTSPTTAPDAGTAVQSVTFTPTDTTNYNTLNVSVDVTVAKADPTVTAWPTASAITYGQSLASSSLAGGTASTAGTFVFTNPATAPDAGTAAQSVTFAPADTTNYNTLNGSVDVTVAKADPTVTTWPTASAITYGQTLASSTLTGGTASIAGTFVFTTPTTAPNAGTAAQSVTFTPADANNYNTEIGSVDVTVTKADPTVTVWPTATAITYGQTLASSSVTGGSASTAGTFAFTNPASAPNAGTADHSVTFTPADTTNYNTVTGPVSVTVTPATLTVTADSLSKSYGSANPALTVSYSGFVNGDTAASLTTQPTAATAATIGSPVGTYPITASGGVSGNYSFTYAAGSLTITTASLVVTAENHSKTYGAANPVLTISYSGFVNGDTSASLTTQPTADTAATTGSPVGTYPITVSGGAGSNYSFTYVAGTLTVDPAMLTVAADNQSRAYGTANPPLTVSYSGFVNGDTAAGLTTQPAAVTSAVIDSPVGTYPITVSGGASGNYNFTYVAGTLTVTTGDPVVTVWPTASAITYGDTLASSTLAGGSASVPGSFSFTLPVTVPNAGTAAQSVTFTPADTTNYNSVTGSVNVIVAKANPVITTWPAASAITYGQTLAASALTGGTASVAGSFAFTVPGTAPNAGTAAHDVTFTPTDTGNYNPANGSVSVVVNPALLTVTADDQTKIYGAVNPPLTVSYNGFVNGETAGNLASQPTAGTTAVLGSPAGTYPITVSGGVSSNYEFNYVAGTLTVTAPTITVTAFALPETATTLEVPVASFTATDAVGVAGYLITETATVPSAGDAGWTPTAPTSFTFGGYGSRTAYAWAKDAIGNVSASLSATVTVNDVIPPAVTAFVLPATSTSLTVAVTGLTATDNLEVTGYLITESTTAPGPGDAGWSGSAPGSFTFGGYGTRTAYAWAKDAAGNVSASLNATVLITGSAASMTVSGIASPRTAGTAGTVTVTAKDANGYVATTYRGTIRFASSDPRAVLPSEYTFTAADNGMHTFDLAVTLKTAGPQSVTATDIDVPIITGLQEGIIVESAQAHSLHITGISSPVTAGTASTVTVTARDLFGNIATGYTGTVRFSSTDPQAVLPADFSFSAGNAGVHVFDSRVTLRTAGIRSVTVTDINTSSLTATMPGITVNPGAAATLMIAGIASPRPADVPSTVTITLRDAHGNIASGYRGTVRFGSTDPQAILPSDYTFGAGDAGSHSFDFMVSLKSAGIHTVTATDVADPGISGSQADIEVTPGVVALQAAQAAAGFSHTAVLDTEGRVWTWGKNDAGQLGIGTTVDGASPVQVVGISGVVAIAAGYEHTVALRNDGTVWTWGSNEYGQLGDGSTIDRAIPVKVSGVAGITAIAAGSYHSLALKADGTVVGWGRNAYGQLGDRTTTNRSQPVQAYGMTGVTALAAGGNHTLLLTGNGDVWTMGANGSGQLGNGAFGDSAIPVRVQGLAGAKVIAAGLLHSLAIDNEGTAWAWGDNGSGQLGEGTSPNSSYPIRVAALSDVVKVAGGSYHTLALKDDGTLWSWGRNDNGQLGNGTTAGSIVPKQLQEMTGITGIVALAAGGRHNAVVMGNGTVWTWGDNAAGQLGDGSTSYKEHFVPVRNITDISSTEVGGNHTVVLKTDGTVWTWGKNAFGQLGNGTLANSSQPGQVPGLTSIVAVAAGTSHTAALKNDGTVWAWGLNESGQLGDGTVTARRLPVQVQGLADVTAISAGSYFTLALKSDGTVWGWGSNTSGQLGDNTTISKTTPVRVGNLTEVSAITAGYLHALALKSDGTVWGWGFNRFGQLGDTTNTMRTLPVQSAIANAVAIAAGSNHSLALQSGGSLWAWGLNGYGQLGDGTTTDRNVPIEVPALQGVTGIVAGSNHSLALMWDRSVWLWGDNFYGQLGDGSGENENVPQQVQEFFDVGAIAAGGENSLLVKNDGSLWTVGDNDSGQLGSGTPYVPAVVPDVLLGNDDMPPVTTASLPEGTYEGTQTIVLSSSEPGIIYYTLDGTTPTTGSSQYNSTLSISSSAILKFFAVDRAGNVEAVKTRNYVVNPQYPLNVYLQGGGSGRIDLSTGGSCTGACSQSFPNGTTVDLTPVPLGDSVFMGWSGCDSVLGQVCRVTVTSARSVTANFDPAFPLALGFVESGTVSFSTGGSCTGACARAFRSGTTVELTASGNGTVFEAWSGCDTASGNSCIVTMSGSRNITASFGYLVMTSGGKGISIQQAYDQVAGSAVVSVRAAEVIENVNFNRPVTIRLAGGYNSSFTDVIGMSTLQGTLTVAAGSVIVERMVIR